MPFQAKHQDLAQQWVTFDPMDTTYYVDNVTRFFIESKMFNWNLYEAGKITKFSIQGPPSKTNIFDLSSATDTGKL